MLDLGIVLMPNQKGENIMAKKATKRAKPAARKTTKRRAAPKRKVAKRKSAARKRS